MGGSAAAKRLLIGFRDEHFIYVYSHHHDPDVCFFSVSCGGGIFDEPQGHLLSPGYPDAPPHGVSCQYIISVESGFVVTLKFSDTFEIESVDTEQGQICPHHWLQVPKCSFHGA